MKTRAYLMVMLITVLAMVAGYLGGSLVSAQTQPSLTEPNLPTHPPGPWFAGAAVEAVSCLLLLESESDTMVYLPLVLMRR